MKTERDLALPSELAEGYRATFDRLCRMFRARGVPASETADLAQETIARTLLHLSRRGMLHPAAAAANGNGGTNGHAGTNGHMNGHRNGEVANQAEPPDQGIEPLIKRIAINLLIDRARAAAPQLLPIDGAEDLAEPGLDPGDEVARRQQRTQVHRAIDDLSVRHRTAMLLSLEGLTPAEIADHLGIRRNAADALLYRARRSLAKHLSAVTGLIRGLALLAALKLRALTRRAETAQLADATVAGHAVLGIAAAALGSVLAFTVPAAVPADAAGRDRISVATRNASAEQHGAAPSASAVASEQATAEERAAIAPEADLDIEDHSVKTGARVEDPATGEEEGFGVDLIHHRDDQDRGTTGPLLDRATDTACRTTTTCEE